MPLNPNQPVAFSVWANSGTNTHYTINDRVVFDEVISNFGGHYSTNTSSFVCPWNGVYMLSAHIQGFNSSIVLVDLMRNDEVLAQAWGDSIPGFYNRASNTVITECNQGDELWVRSGIVQYIYGWLQCTVLTGCQLHRY